jgi:hypothetical protein
MVVKDIQFNLVDEKGLIPEVQTFDEMSLEPPVICTSKNLELDNSSIKGGPEKYKDIRRF